MKLSHSKTVTATFNFNKREAKHELKVYNKINFYHSVRSYIPWGKAEKIAHVSSQPCGTAQKISSRVVLLFSVWST